MSKPIKTVQDLLEKASAEGFIYDTGDRMASALHECLANNWLIIQEGGRYYLTKAGEARRTQ